MKFTLALLALSSVFGPADAAALRNSNALVITSDESESTGDTPKPADDPHSFLSENGSSTTACDPKCQGGLSCIGDDGPWVDQSKIGCGSCLGISACYHFTGNSVGEKSCTEKYSCCYVSAIIGNNSCQGVQSCVRTTGYIGNNQCNSSFECKDKHFPALSLYMDRPYTDECRDSEGGLYGMIEGTTYSSKDSLTNIVTTHLPEESPGACAQFCRQPSLTNGFQVGMQFGAPKGESVKCLCLYDVNGELPRAPPGDDLKRIFELIPARKGYAVREDEYGKGPIAPGILLGIACYPLKDTNLSSKIAPIHCCEWDSSCCG